MLRDSTSVITLLLFAELLLFFFKFKIYSVYKNVCAQLFDSLILVKAVCVPEKYIVSEKILSSRNDKLWSKIQCKWKCQNSKEYA